MRLTGRLLGLFLSIFATACASTQVTPLGPVPAGVIVDLQEDLYAVAGASEEELQRQMDALGPGPSWFNFRWRVEWNYQYREVEEPSIIESASTETVCQAHDIRITLHYTRTVPQWDPPEDAPEELVGNWEGYLQALRVHGEGHRDIAVDAVREIKSRLEDLQLSNCAFFEREARQLAERILERANQADREYDETTERGKTQGVVWPYRGTGQAAALLL